MSEDRPTLRAIPQPPVSLTEQWMKLEIINREIRDRARREHVAIMAEYNRRRMELQNEYARNLSELTTKLDKDHAQAMEELEAETAAKLRDHETLAERMRNPL